MQPSDAAPKSIFEFLLALPSALDTVDKLIFGVLILSFCAVFFIKSRLLQWTFSLICVVTLVALVGRNWPQPPLPPTRKETSVRVKVADETDSTIVVKHATAFIPNRDDIHFSREVNASGVASVDLKEDELPFDLDNWTVDIVAEGYQRASAVLKRMPDGSRESFVHLKPLPPKSKPAEEIVTAQADAPAQAPMPVPPAFPSSSPASPNDVRGWKITIFGCSEYTDASMPLAKKIANELKKAGYNNVLTKRWPLAGTQQTVGGQTYFYALTSEFTLNLTNAKAAQAQQLKADLMSIPNLPNISEQLVASEYARSLTAVVCPGYSDKDKFDG